MRPDRKYEMTRSASCPAEFIKPDAVVDDLEDSVTTIPDFVTNISSKPSKGKDKEEEAPSKVATTHRMRGTQLKYWSPGRRIQVKTQRSRRHKSDPRETRERASFEIVGLPSVLFAPNTVADMFVRIGRKNKPKSRSSKQTSANSRNARAETPVRIQTILTPVAPKRKRNPASPIWRKSSRGTPRAVCLQQGEDVTKRGRKRKRTKPTSWPYWMGLEGG